MEETKLPFRARAFSHWPLFVIAVAFILLAGLYAAVTPPFEGPDEAQHIAYIEWLIRQNSFPPQGEAAWETPVEQEAGQTPLYYLLASLLARLVGVDEPTAVYRPNPHFTGPLPRTIPDNDNRALHLPGDGQPLRGGWLAIYLSRTLTILFGVLFIAGTYGVAWQTRPGDRVLAASAAWLIAFTPQVLFIGSMTSNDVPTAAFSAVTLWLLIILLRRAPTIPPYLPLLIGVMLALAALTKINSLVLGAPIGMGLLLLWLVRPLPLPQVFRYGLWMLGGFVAVAGWWFIRTWWLYGSPLGLETHDLTPWVIDDPEKLAAWWARWLEVWRYYWVALGWGTIRPVSWVYTLIFFLTALALLGLLIGFIRRARGADRQITPTILILIVLITAVLANALFLEIWMRRVVAPYGRLLFPSAAAITVLLLLGWRVIHRRFVWLPLALVTILGLATPFALLRPAYTPQTISAAEAAALPASIGWRFGPNAAEPIAELLTFAPLQTSVPGGRPLPIEVCWRVLAQTEEPYTVFIHVIGPENSLITHRRSYPGNGLWQTTFWQPGTTLCNIMHVPVWEDLAVTGVFDLEIGFLNEASDQRLLTFDAQGNLRPHNFLGKVRLESVRQPPPTLTQLPGSGPLQLIAATIPTTTWTIGQTASFTLQWAAATPPIADYQVFVHLRDANNQVAAQADGPPVGGWYPTSWWPVGEVITDERTFTVPADLPRGLYQLVVGFYNLETLEPVGDAHDLGAIQIEP